MRKRKLNEAYADIELFIALDESLEEVFDYYSYTYPELTFEVLTMESIFTGWPEVRVSGNRKNLMLFLLDYFAGEDEEFISNFIEESKKLNEEFHIGVEIYDVDGLRGWAHDNCGSGARDRLEDFDSMDGAWDALYEYLDALYGGRHIDGAELNDFLWFEAEDYLKELGVGVKKYIYTFPLLSEEEETYAEIGYDLEVEDYLEDGQVQLVGTKEKLMAFAQEVLAYELVDEYLEEYQEVVDDE